MTRIKNEVRLEGFLYEAPKFQSSKDGKPYVSFNISTRNSYFKDDAWHQKKRMNHFPVGFSLGVIKQAEQFQKDDLVVITAELEYRQVVDSDGNKYYTASIIATKIQAVESKSANTESSNKVKQNSERLSMAIKSKQKNSASKVLASILGALIFFV